MEARERGLRKRVREERRGRWRTERMSGERRAEVESGNEEKEQKERVE